MGPDTFCLTVEFNISINPVLGSLLFSKVILLFYLLLTDEAYGYYFIKINDVYMKKSWTGLAISLL